MNKIKREKILKLYLKKYLYLYLYLYASDWEEKEDESRYD